jgi:hypothetical protein
MWTIWNNCFISEWLETIFLLFDSLIRSTSIFQRHQREGETWRMLNNLPNKETQRRMISGPFVEKIFNVFEVTFMGILKIWNITNHTDEKKVIVIFSSFIICVKHETFFKIFHVIRLSKIRYRAKVIGEGKKPVRTLIKNHSKFCYKRWNNKQ